MGPQERKAKVVIGIQLACFPDQRWFTETCHHTHAEHLEGKSCAVICSEDGKGRVSNLSDELRVLEEARQLLSNHADAGDQSLSLRLSSLYCLLADHIKVKLLPLGGERLAMLLLLVELLLLN